MPTTISAVSVCLLDNGQINGLKKVKSGVSATERKCTHVYPTAIRARGAAWAVAFGRLGAILSGAAGAVVLSAGASAYFILLGTAMFLVLIALAMVRRHIPASVQIEKQQEPI